MGRKEIQLESGVLLVAPPAMVDPNFRKSVVLLCEHTAAGSFGLILNHNIAVGMGELIADLSSFTEPVRIGGPVQLDTLHFLHRFGSDVSGAIEIFKGAFWGGELDDLQRLFVEKTPSRDDLRFFLGYAGWSPNQLENELSEHAWIVTELDSRIIMADPDLNLWQDTLEGLDGKYRTWINFPENPSLN